MGRGGRKLDTKMGIGTRQMAPVDQYRHQVGRQESKKLLRNETKQRRRKESERVQKSGAVGYCGAVLLVFLLVLTALYLLAYFVAQKGSNAIPSFPFLQPMVDYIEKSYKIWLAPYLPLHQ